MNVGPVRNQSRIKIHLPRWPKASFGGAFGAFFLYQSAGRKSLTCFFGGGSRGQPGLAGRQGGGVQAPLWSRRGGWGTPRTQTPYTLLMLTLVQTINPKKMPCSPQIILRPPHPRTVPVPPPRNIWSAETHHQRGISLGGGGRYLAKIIINFPCKF